jgi:hypothetical protein
MPYSTSALLTRNPQDVFSESDDRRQPAHELMGPLVPI